MCELFFTLSTLTFHMLRTAAAFTLHLSSTIHLLYVCIVFSLSISVLFRHSCYLARVNREQAGPVADKQGRRGKKKEKKKKKREEEK